MLDFGFYNMDCMDGMKEFPDKFFDLAIVDPPYFKGPNERLFYGKEINNLKIKRKEYPVIEEWEVPTKEYFEELKRVSKHQIIWGINYFPEAEVGSGRIVWNKVNGKSSFSDCEIAYCSKHDSVRLVEYMWNGMMQGKSIAQGRVMQGDKSKNEFRIHPTQKPVILYEWTLSQYAENGYKLLDTHTGSASILVACHRLGFKEVVAFEKDKHIYEISNERLKNEKSQTSIFDFIER